MRLCSSPFLISDENNKSMCFNGLARQIHSVASDNVDAVFGMCGLLPSEWFNYCINSIVAAEYSVGGRELPFEICNRVGQESRAECYEGLIGLIKNSGENYNNLCDKIRDVI